MNEPIAASGSPGEILSKRCVNLIKIVLKPDVWKDFDLKLSWFDKLFATLETVQVNIPNTCTALEVLTFVIGVLSRDSVLEHMKILQKGIASCMTCQSGKVIRSAHSFMSKLMSLFPTEFPTSNSAAATACKYPELETLYTCVSKVVYEGMSTYEISSAGPQALLGSLMMLKAACANNPCYIDRIITPFMKCLQKLSREHLNTMSSAAAAAAGASASGSVNIAGSAESNLTTEMLILSLDLVKNRVGVMGLEMRKAFIGTVLVSLIEKSVDSKVMLSIVKIVEEWVTAKIAIIVNQGPSIREKSILLTKLMQNVEKRFGSDTELVGVFLELIIFIYTDDSLRNSELNSKLEPAFLSGLRCTQPEIRAKFFKVFDSSMRKRVHERLMYIVCSQNWEAMGPHYWIKQCEELLYATVASVWIELSPKASVIPGVAHGFYVMEQDRQDSFLTSDLTMRAELLEHEMTFVQPLEKDVEILEGAVDQAKEGDEDDSDTGGKSKEDKNSVEHAIKRLEDAFINEGWVEPSHPAVNTKVFCIKQKKLEQMLLSTVNTVEFCRALVQLCHWDTSLAEHMWVALIPRLWSTFTEKQQMALANEMTPFLCSGVHVLQQNNSPSVISTFVEALSHCVPTVPLRP